MGWVICLSYGSLFFFFFWKTFREEEFKERLELRVDQAGRDGTEALTMDKGLKGNR